MSPSLNEIMNLRMHASVKEYPSNQAANNKIPGPETEDFLVVGPVGLEPTTHGLKVRFMLIHIPRLDWLLVRKPVNTSF